MKASRRRFLHVAAGAATLPAASAVVLAQGYPAHPARMISQWLSERSGQQFVVENRPGANGNVGTEVVVRSPADGYTLLMIDASPTINATLYKKLNFSFVRDIVPIATVIRA